MSSVILSICGSCMVGYFGTTILMNNQYDNTSVAFSIIGLFIMCVARKVDTDEV